MPRRHDLIILRNQHICAKYKKLSAITEHGVAKYSFDWIMKNLEQSFYLDAVTLWDIVRDEPKGGYKMPGEGEQLTIM